MHSLDARDHDYATARTKRDELLSRALLAVSAIIAVVVFGVLVAVIR